MESVSGVGLSSHAADLLEGENLDDMYIRALELSVVIINYLTAVFMYFDLKKGKFFF
jgi:hypothetical protein